MSHLIPAAPSSRSLVRSMIALAVVAMLWPQMLHAQYCSVGMSYCTYEYISSVSFGSMTNASSQTCYSDFSTLVAAPSIVPGQNYLLSIQQINNYPDQVFVWVDWNANYVFDATEAYTVPSIVSGALYQLSITVPVTATPGLKRMRICLTDYGAMPSPCANPLPAYGEWEDYSVNVLSLSNPYPTIAVTSSPSCWASPSNQTVIATITDNGSIADSRVWFRKGTGAWQNTTVSSIVGTTHTFTINHSLVGGVINGDVISWYLAAQDNQGAVVTSPSGGGGTTPTGSTPPAVFNTYTIGVAKTMPYVETFDGAAPGFTFGGTNSSWRIGAPAGTIGTTAYSAPNALCGQTATGTMNISENSIVYLPAMDFGGMVNDPVLTFYFKYYYESGWDGCWIEYSTNCGALWSILGTVSDPTGANWYSGTMTYSLGNACWTGGPMTTWTKAVKTLTGLKGVNGVLLRLRQFEDGYGNYAGITIDDIAVGDFPQKDLQLVDAYLTYAPNRWAYILGETHQAKVVVKNNGWEANPASVSLTLTVNGIPVATESFSPTWVAGQATLTFATPVIPPTTGTYTGSVTINYPSDMNPANNTVTRTYTVDDNKVYGNEPFVNVAPPAFWMGWTVFDNNGGVTWKTETVGSETYMTYPGAAAADDWVFTPAALLQAGSSYRLQFQYRSISGVQAFDVAYGTAPNAASMTTMASFNNITANAWTNALGAAGVAPYFNTDPAGAQNYYIGFHVRSGVAGALQIDNVKLDVNPTPPPKIGVGLVGTPQGQHIDNMATPVQLMAVYKKPGVISRTYEVVSTTYNYGAPGDFLWDISTATTWLKLTKSSAAATQYLTANPYNPARPRQQQTFTLSVDPAGMLPGTYTGAISLVGSLYNSQYPGGIKATNEVLNLPVVLTITDPNAGLTQQGSQKACMTNLVTSPVPYIFKDAAGVPMAAVTVTSGSIPSMCIEQFPGQVPYGISRYRYVQKYFTINASGTWTANIDWYYSLNEATAGGVSRFDLLRVIRQYPVGGVWQDPIPGVTSASFPMTNSVRGTGYSNLTQGGNHCLVTSWFTPKEGPAPTAFDLTQNYPNPFNPSTSFEFSIPAEQRVSIVVLNSLGEEVARLVDEVRPAGTYGVTFDASDLPSGAYVCRMTAGSFTRTMRMMLAK